MILHGLLSSGKEWQCLLLSNSLCVVGNAQSHSAMVHTVGVRLGTDVVFTYTSKGNISATDKFGPHPLHPHILSMDRAVFTQIIGQR